jgi:tRNA(Leu) C34 or U34 (ribose-2'-O)-methylase TrmL
MGCAPSSGARGAVGGELLSPAEPAPAPAPAPPPHRRDGDAPSCYLIIVAVQKRLNIGMTLRAAVAFGVTELIIVGSKKHLVNTHGAHGAERYVDLRHFHRLQQAVGWLKARGVAVCGIEITPDAAPVHAAHAFRGPTAFLAGAEGEGLVPAHKAACDHFVYVPQHGGGGTASLNVSVATAIVLHRFALWAGTPEVARERGRDKFVVPPPPDRRAAALTPFDLELQGARRAAHAAAAAEPDADALAAAPLPGGGGAEEELGAEAGEAAEAAGGGARAVAGEAAGGGVSGARAVAGEAAGGGGGGGGGAGGGSGAGEDRGR